jgi:hypothetical protein
MSIRTAVIIRWPPVHPLTRAYKAFLGAHVCQLLSRKDSAGTPSKILSDPEPDSCLFIQSRSSMLG